MDFQERNYMEILEKVVRNDTRYYVVNSEKEVLAITDIAGNTKKDELLIKQIGRFIGGRIYCSTVPDKTGTCYRIEDYIYFNNKTHAEKFLDAIIDEAFDPHKRMEFIIQTLRRYKIEKSEMDKLLWDIRNDLETLTSLGAPEKIEAFAKMRLGKNLEMINSGR